MNWLTYQYLKSIDDKRHYTHSRLFERCDVRRREYPVPAVYLPQISPSVVKDVSMYPPAGCPGALL
jgi:hypothetical protein